MAVASAGEAAIAGSKMFKKRTALTIIEGGWEGTKSGNEEGTL